MIRLDIYANPTNDTYVFVVCPKTKKVLVYTEDVVGDFRWATNGGAGTHTLSRTFWKEYYGLSAIEKRLNVVKVGFLDLDTGIAYMDGKYPVNGEAST